jgi:hypothetical protein
MLAMQTSMKGCSSSYSARSMMDSSQMPTEQYPMYP